MIWLLVPGAVAVGIGIALVVASATTGGLGWHDAALTGLLARLRHSSLAHRHRRHPSPGRHGPGLRPLSWSGDEGRFWAVIAPFTPDDNLCPELFAEPGRSRTVACELTATEPHWHGPWASFDQIRAAFTPDDGAGYWHDPAPKLGDWRTIDLTES